jgi:hypothetical protein
MLSVRLCGSGQGEPAAPLGVFHAEFDRMVDPCFRFWAVCPPNTPGFTQSRTLGALITPLGRTSTAPTRNTSFRPIASALTRKIHPLQSAGILVLSTEGPWKRPGKRLPTHRASGPPGGIDRDQISAKLHKGVPCIVVQGTAKPENRFERIGVTCPVTA